jgi:hypothetical protein
MISPTTIERARDKLFVNTYCIGEPPDVELAVGYYFDALRNMIDREKQAPIWRVEQQPVRHQGSGGVYFIATSEYLNAPAYQGATGVMRCVCRIEAGGFDRTGRHCMSAYPLHVNLAFSDNNRWQIPVAERLAGNTVAFCERSFCTTIGMPDPSGNSNGRFQLQEGAWVNGPFYPN